MENKNRLIKTIAIISALVLMVLTVLPGCNFIGNAGEEDITSAVDTNVEQQVCCPVCSSTNVTGPDDDGHYNCNDCEAIWSFTDTAIEVVDEQGNVVDTLDKSAGYVNGNSGSVSSDGTTAEAVTGGNGSSNSGSGSSGNGGSSNNGGSKNNGGSSNSGTNTTKKSNGGSGTKASTATYTTNKNTSEQVKTNLEKLKQAADKLDESVEIVYDEETQSYTVKSKDGTDTGLFGYKYSTKDKIFYTAEDSWQRNFGFTEFYDTAAAAGFMTYNTMRVRFDYDNEEWMLQFWKGQYGYTFIGAEVGVYTRPMGSDNGTYYDCADDEHKMYMTMDLYRKESGSNKFKKLFTRSRVKTWWCTGFIPGTLGFAQANVPDEGGTGTLKCDTRIEFHSAEMAQAFCESLSKVTYLENNSLVSGTNRSVKFYEFATEEAYDASAASCKYCICEDGKTVRVCYR